jgi:erythrin-vacuolar iron transport family protein
VLSAKKSMVAISPFVHPVTASRSTSRSRCENASRSAPLRSSAGTTLKPAATAAVGAAISMGVSEARSDDGSLTGRGHPLRRGVVTGLGTLIGAGGHALPFLIPHYHTAGVVAVELLAIAWIRRRWFLGTSVRSSIVQVTLAGILVFAVGLAFGGA